MKKILLFFGLLIISCSGSNDNISDSPPENTISIKDATITPKYSKLSGYNSKLDFEVKVGNSIIPNNNLTWSTDNSKSVFLNYGTLYSRIIGSAKITVKDKNNNTLTADVVIEPSILSIPLVPFIKWGATGNEVMSSVNWDLYDNPYPYNTTPSFKKDNFILKYFISSTEGLYRIDLSHISEINNLSKYKTYFDERYEKVESNDPGFMSHTRWYSNDLSTSKKTYMDIGEKSNLVYYLRFMSK
ncbi:hypothetical protein [Chryseobacterium sp.]|uniref:hypothetical protein n=1 Tax=Chryseobacterium sp. TaxID=1871047 RepID=UPI002898C774|nr:hypothetical protein [Chryseobacterium sp.]